MEKSSIVSHTSIRLITKKVPSHALGCKRKMNNKRNVVLYLDKELVEKTRELGFNLSKTFENHLKQLLTQVLNVNSVNNSGITGSWCGRRDLNPGSQAWKACVLTSLDDDRSLAQCTALFSILKCAR